MLILEITCGDKYINIRWDNHLYYDNLFVAYNKLGHLRSDAAHGRLMLVFHVFNAIRWPPETMTLKLLGSFQIA